MTEGQLSFYKEQFQKLWPHLETALISYGETHSKDEVWSLIESGKAQFWPLPNAALVTQIDKHNTGLTELRVWLAGGDVHEIASQEPIIEQWAKDEGCQRAVIFGRRGWQRTLHGFRDAGAILIKDF